MELPDDQGLLVVNLDNCISNTAGEQVMKSECVYAVAVASNTCDDEGGTVIQIPVSVHCSEGAQQQFTTVTQLDAPQNYGDMQAQHYTEINVEDGISCLETVGDRDQRIQDEHITSNQQDSFLSKSYQRQCEDTDAYYTEIFNYLNSQILPDGATESYRKLLKKKACNYKISNGILYYGHKEAKRVISQRKQQIEILKNTHVEKHSGVHLGLKKMYIAINDNYFWKGLYVDIANYVRQCKQCSESANMEGTNDEETEHLGKSKGPDNISEEKCTGHGKFKKVWQKVELNVYGPYPRTTNQNEFIITIADPFSRWIVARPIPNNYLAESISSFVFKTFCTFGFAKCSCIGLNREIFETVITKYQESMSQIQDTLLTYSSMVNTLSSMSSAHNSLSLVSENLSECVWVRKLWDDFVAVNLETWDLELERFLFKYCTSASKETASPFSAMFDRSPVSCLEEDKVNFDVVENSKPIETMSKRRRLQSSILQCRHCEEIFTSKISFRIHQRKHTEEARRQGILEGQEPLRSTSERERKLLRRTALKRKQRILKHGNVDHKERLMSFASRRLHPYQEYLPKDKRRAELQANTVDAVKKLLASTKEERRRRGRYHKYSAELHEEIACFALEHGSMETAKHFTQKMGRTLSESTVRNIVKLYRNFTPGLKEEIGRFALCFGVEVACNHFTEKLGQEVRRGLVRKFKKQYLTIHPEIENRQINNSKENKESNIESVNVKPKTVYTTELKDEIGSYACQYGISATVQHFSNKLPFPPKESTVRKFRKLYLDKHRATQQVSMLQQQLQLGPNTGNIQETVNPSMQTIDILHTSLNILNNTQISGPSAVVYNAPFQSATLPPIHPSSPIIPSSNASSSVPLSFHSVNCGEASAATSYHQTPVTTSVIMNQNTVAFNQSSVPLHSFQQSQTTYSSYSNLQSQTDNTLLSQKSAISTIPQTQLAHHSVPQVTSSFTPSTIPTITFAIASPSQQQFQNISNSPAVVMSHRSQPDDQQPILVSHESNGTTVIQHLVASSLSHPHLHQDPHQQLQSQQRQLQQSLPHEIIGPDITNSSSQVLVQQPSVLSESLLVDQHSLPNHTQIVEQQNLETATYVQALNDNTASLSFDTSGSTLIADRDGTYSIATAVDNDISITIEKDSNLETFSSGDESVTIQTQETQTSRETDDVVISVVSKEVSGRMKNKSAVEMLEEVTCNEMNQEQETKVIHVLKVDCSMEEDVDDPESVKEMPNKKKKTGSCSYNKKSSSGGHKRGNYTVYSPEIRAEMGKFAAEYGSQRACQHFKSILGHVVPESTIRGLRDKYLLKREHCVNSSSGDKEITSLGYAPRGRPMRLGKYDEVVQECIRELIRSGEKVSSFLAIATAKQVLMQFEPGLLEENGGKVKLNMTWAKSFLKRIGVQNKS